MPRSFVQPSAELLDLIRKQGQPVVESIGVLTIAVAEAEVVRRGVFAVQAAEADLARRIAELMGLANMLARRRVVIAANRLGAEDIAAPPARPPAGPGQVVTFGDDAAGLIPKVTWKEAVTQIADRYPATVPANVLSLGPTEVQKWIGGLYEANGITLARTAQSVVVERVRNVLARAVEKGTPKKQALADIVSAGAEHGDDFSRAYAETVFRNNLNSAYSAGLHDQMGDPNVQRVIGALQFVAARDSDTTDICRAAHGTVAPSDHGIWDERTPPLHHNCRSGIHFVTRTDLKRMGVLDENGIVKPIIPNHPPTAEQTPTPGFGGRRT